MPALLDLRTIKDLRPEGESDDEEDPDEVQLKSADTARWAYDYYGYAWNQVWSLSSF